MFDYDDSDWEIPEFQFPSNGWKQREVERIGNISQEDVDNFMNEHYGAIDDDQLDILIAYEETRIEAALRYGAVGQIRIGNQSAQERAKGMKSTWKEIRELPTTRENPAAGG